MHTAQPGVGLPSGLALGLHLEQLERTGTRADRCTAVEADRVVVGSTVVACPSAPHLQPLAAEGRPRTADPHQPFELDRRERDQSSSSSAVSIFSA